jgi:hypothetical protein
MVGAHTKIVKDVPPYVTVDGTPAHVVGLNKVGLRRGGMELTGIAQLKEAYRLIYRRGLRWKDVLEALAAEFKDGPAAAYLDFFQAGKRGFTPERRTPKAAMLRLVNGDTTDDAEDRRTEAAQPRELSAKLSIWFGLRSGRGRCQASIFSENRVILLREGSSRPSVCCLRTSFFLQIDPDCAPFGPKS